MSVTTEAGESNVLSITGLSIRVPYDQPTLKAADRTFRLVQLAVLRRCQGAGELKLPGVKVARVLVVVQIVAGPRDAFRCD